MPRPRKRWTLLIALLVFAGVVIWLASSPRVLAPWLSQLAANHLLKDADGDVRITSFEGNPFRGMTLYGVDLVSRNDRGGEVRVAADTLRLEYRLGELTGSPPRLRAVEAAGLRVAVFAGEHGEDDDRPFGLPPLLIDRLVLSRGALAISDADGVLQEEFPLIAATGSASVDTLLNLELAALDALWTTRLTRIEDVAVSASFTDDFARVRSLEGVVRGIPLSVSGGVGRGGYDDLRIAARGASTAVVEEVGRFNLGVAAAGDVDLTLDGRSESLVMDMVFDGELEGYELEDFHGRARLTDETLVWGEMEGRINGAGFRGRGYFDILDTNDVVMELRGEVVDVDLARDLVPEAVLPASDGRGRLKIWRREFTDETVVTGWLRDGFIDTVPFDSVAVEVRGDAGGVDFELLDLFYEGQKASLTGRADKDGLFGGELILDVPDLTRLADDLKTPGLRGALRAEGRVEGRDPVFDYQAVATILGGGAATADVDSLFLRVRVDDVIGDPAVRARGDGTGFALGGVPLGLLSFDVAVSREAMRLERFHAARGDTSVQLRGGAEFGPGRADFHVPEFRAVLAGNEWSLEDSLDLSVSPGRILVEPFVLSSDLGAIEGRLVSDRDRDLFAGALDLKRFDLNFAEPFVGGGDLSGDLSAVCRFSGTPADPTVEVSALLEDADLALARIDSLRVSGELGGGVLDLRSLALDSEYGRVAVRGTVSHPGVAPAAWWPGAALELELDITDGDWDFMTQFEIPALDRIAGRVDGALSVRGTTSAPKLDGELHGAPFHVHWLHLDELHGGLSFDDETLFLTSLQGRKGPLELTGRIELPLLLDFMSEPVSPVDGPLFMSLGIPPGSDLSALADMTNAFASSSGRGALDLQISGPADHPSYTGTVDVDDAAFVINNLSEQYREASCRGVWRGDTLSVYDIRATEGLRGRLEGEGVLVFRGLELETFDLALDADRFLLASIPDMRVLLRGDDVRLRGVKVGPDSLLVPRFEGAVQVIEGRYTGDFSEQGGEASVDPLESSMVPDWEADLAITAPPRTVRILNQTMEIFAGGDVGLRRDIEGLKVRGTANLDQGRLPVFNNDFKVTRGTAEFNGTGIFPNLDVTAETKVRLPAYDGGTRRQETIWIDISGSALEPTVDFRSESGYARQNIERMLLGMSPHATDTQTTSFIRTEGLAAGFNLLEREVAQSQNLFDTFDIVSGRPRADGTLQTLVGVGKYIGRDLYVKFAQAVTDRDREVIVEYMFTDRLLLQTEVSSREYEFLGDTTYSVDLKYRLEY